MAQVLNGPSGVVCYIDDILVTGHTREEHLANLKAVLTRICEYGLRLKQSVSVFQSQLEFLGHVISAQGVKPIQRAELNVYWRLSSINYQTRITVIS